MCSNNLMLPLEHTRENLEASPVLLMAWKMPQLDPRLPWGQSHDPKFPYGNSQWSSEPLMMIPANQRSHRPSSERFWGPSENLKATRSSWFVPPVNRVNHIPELANSSYKSCQQAYNIEPVALLSVFATRYESSAIIYTVPVYSGLL